jgi:hypothetical protein
MPTDFPSWDWRYQEAVIERRNDLFARNLDRVAAGRSARSVTLARNENVYWLVPRRSLRRGITWSPRFRF